MNNNNFALVRYLRDRGVDATLFLTENELNHFHPSADCYNDNWKTFTVQLSWGSGSVKNFFCTSKKEIKKTLKTFDVILASGCVPAYLEKAGLRVDVFVPYGSDVYKAPDYRKAKKDLFFPLRILPKFFQRKGLARSKILNSICVPSLENYYSRLFTSSKRWTCGIPMVHLPTYSSTVIPPFTRDIDTVQRLAKDSLIFIFHSRHQMGDSLDPSTKRPDRFIRGVHLFAENNPSTKFKIITFDYGEHVKDSKQLIAELNLQKHFVWLNKANRKDIIPILHKSDLVFGQFNENIALNGVLQEALAAGKPILTHKADPAQANDFLPFYPHYSAKEPEEISIRLKEFCGDIEKGREIGREGRKWYENYCQNAINQYVEFIMKIGVTHGCSGLVASSK
jgi:glycosyltransferase involved in cell wall biosynthesis